MGEALRGSTLVGKSQQGGEEMNELLKVVTDGERQEEDKIKMEERTCE